MYNIKKILLIFSISLSLFSNVIAMPPKADPGAEKETATQRLEVRKRKEGFGAVVQKSKKTGKSGSSSGAHLEKDKPTSLPQGVGRYETFRKILSQGPEPIVDTRLSPITPEKEEKEGSRRFVPSFVREASESTKPEIWHKESEQRVMSFKRYAVGLRFIADTTNVALGRISFFSAEGTPMGSPKEIKYVFLSGWPADAVINEEKNPVTGVETLVQNLKEGAVKITDGVKKKEVLKDYGIRYITRDYPQREGTQLPSRCFDPFFEKIHGIMTEEAQKDRPLLGEERLKFHKKLTKKPSEWSIQKLLYFHTEQAIRRSIHEAIDRYNRYKRGKLSVDNHYAIIDICSLKDMCWCCGDTLVSQAHLESKFGLKVYFRFSGLNRYQDFPFNEKEVFHLGDKNKKEKFKTYANPEDHPVYDTQSSDYRPYVAHMVTDDLNSQLKPGDQGASAAE